MTQTTSNEAQRNEVTLTRAQAEDFLFAEAALLDEWRLDEWLALFEEGARYEVPPAGEGMDADPATSLFYIADDWARLQHRVRRLNKPAAHSEFPRSKCVRLISNVRVLETLPEGHEVRCVFVTYRSKGETTDRFMGQHRYILRQVGGALRIAYKRTVLVMETLRPQGRVSIIV
jgi:p-cumate 2,3-dioxygenase beta subunit